MARDADAAAVFRPPNHRTWRYSFRDNGRRYTGTTGQITKDDAIDFVRNLRIQMFKGRNRGQDPGASSPSEEYRRQVEADLDASDAVLKLREFILADLNGALARGERLCMVYFITDGTALKIGIAKNIERRLEALQSAHYKELILVAAIPGNRSVEEMLHGHFDDERLRGEWFSGDRTREFVEHLQRFPIILF
jgi:hypothetical protein